MKFISSIKQARTSKKKYRGLWHTKSDKWIVYCNKKYIGSFNTEIYAAAAYNIAAIKIYGATAKINHGIHPSILLDVASQIKNISPTRRMECLNDAYDKRKNLLGDSNSIKLPEKFDPINIKSVPMDEIQNLYDYRYKGVIIDLNKQSLSWQAYCNKIYIGSFNNPLYAAAMYNLMALHFYGNEAILNEGIDYEVMIDAVLSLPSKGKTISIEIAEQILYSN